jgi:hypothetical protein
MTASKIWGSAIDARYGTHLEQCRDLVSDFVSSHFSDLFEQANTALLEFAERAESNAVQGRFFEAMKQLQRRRPDIEFIFHEELNAGFQNFGATDANTLDRGQGVDLTAGIELSLVEPEDMEESVATENLISRANANYFPDLYALSQRLSVVAGGRKLKDLDIPAAPHHLVHSFQRAMEGLDVEIKVKVILYALFDKVIIRQCGSVYDQYNAILKSAGILPKLKPAYVRSTQARFKAAEQTAERTAEQATASPPDPGTGGQAPSVAAGSDGSAPANLGSELFDSILDLMAARRPTGQRGSGRFDDPGGGRRSRPAGAGEIAAAAKAEILAALSQAQARTAAEVRARVGPGMPDAAMALGGSASGSPELPGYASMEIDATSLDRVRQALTQDRQQILEKIKGEDLSPVDANLIDLIGMLFEYMLNDPVLPNAAKALLSHLHTPYLKVALIDRRLLEDNGHPARRLLDEMVEAGSLLIDETSPAKGIFPVMQQTVDRVLQEFTDDVGVFEELLKNFRQAAQDQLRRTNTVEQRSQAAARGREKLQLAKQRASRHIDTLTTRHPIPEALASFLSTTWLDQLVFILLREKDGDGSTAWRSAIAAGEELVALFDPGASPADRRARIDRIPKLREGVLREVHRMGSFSRTTVDALGSLLDNPLAWKPDLQRRSEARVVSGKPSEQPLGRPAGEPQPEGHPDSPLAEREKEMIERLRQTRVGTWFEFAPHQGTAPRRIKISWISPLTSTCMFVDRSGTQAEVKTLRELADEIQSGRAKVIPRPKHPFIERALLSIRKLLQADGGDAKEAVPS